MVQSKCRRRLVAGRWPLRALAIAITYTLVTTSGCAGVRPGGDPTPDSGGVLPPTPGNDSAPASFDGPAPAADGAAAADAGGASCSRWQAAQVGEVRGLTVAADGTVYVTGPAAGGYFAASHDACGKPLATAQRLPAGASAAGANALALVGSRLFIAGQATSDGASAARTGLLVELDASTLAEQRVELVQGAGGTAADGVHALVADGTSLWAFGTRRESNAPQSWLLRAPYELASTCGTGIDAAPSVGGGQALAIDGGAVFFAGSEGARAFVGRRSASGCTTSSCGDCLTSWRVLAGEGVQAEARAVIVAGNSVYAAGYERFSGNAARAVVWRFDAQTGAALGSFSWDPDATTGEGFFAITSDGSKLYVAGGRGWRQGDFSNTSGAVFALSLDLQQSWSAEPGDSGFYQAITLAADKVIVGGGLGATGVLRSCTRGGSC